MALQRLLPFDLTNTELGAGPGTLLKHWPLGVSLLWYAYMCTYVYVYKYAHIHLNIYIYTYTGILKRMEYDL